MKLYMMQKLMEEIRSVLNKRPYYLLIHTLLILPNIKNRPLTYQIFPNLKIFSKNYLIKIPQNRRSCLKRTKFVLLLI